MKFKSLRSCYQRYKVSRYKWTMLPSGSAGRPRCKPKTYKYASELSFLDDVCRGYSSSSSSSSRSRGDDAMLDMQQAVSDASDTKVRIIGTCSNKESCASENGGLVVPRVEHDDHYAFAMRVYHLMRDMPQGRDLELCRHSVEQVILNAKYSV